MRGDRTDLTAIDNCLFAFVAKLAYRRDNGSGSGSPRLFQLAGINGGFQFINAYTSLTYAIALAPKQLDTGFSGNAGQNGAGQLRRNDLTVDLEHNIHGTDFLDILALHTVQPQHLRITLLFCLFACTVAGSIVTAALGLTRTATDRTDILGLNHNFDRIDALFIVSTNR